jgi:CHAD domain-containing protein
MSYSLSFTETPAEAVERVRREQLGAAADELDEHAEDPVEAVHDARKRIKKTRALLRLARPGMKRGAYRRRNHTLRDTARGLSGARDADVMAETVEDLAERYPQRAPYGPVHDVLASWARETRSAGEPEGAAALLRSLADARWELDGLTRDQLGEALKTTYVRGREAFAVADADPSAENLHEWRKRVKDLWYQQQLLEDSWPKVMKAQAKEAKKLSKLLGEDHDLAVLASLLRKDPELAALSSDLLTVIAERRAVLLKRSRALGRRVYAERPKAFARRSSRYVDLAPA